MSVAAGGELVGRVAGGELESRVRVGRREHWQRLNERARGALCVIALKGRPGRTALCIWVEYRYG